MDKVTRDLIEAFRDTLEEVHDQHIYDRDDEHPDDCCYCSLVAQADAWLLAHPAIDDTVSSKPRVYVTIEGGLVQDVVTDDPSLVGLSVGIIDYDTDGIAEDEARELVTIGDSEGFIRGEAVQLAAFDLKPAHDRLID